MGLKEFWNRLTGGDRDEQMLEDMENRGAESPMTSRTSKG